MSKAILHFIFRYFLSNISSIQFIHVITIKTKGANSIYFVLFMLLFDSLCAGMTSGNFIKYYEPLGFDELILRKAHLKKRESYGNQKDVSRGSSVHMSFAAFGRYLHVQIFYTENK